MANAVTANALTANAVTANAFTANGQRGQGLLPTLGAGSALNNVALELPPIPVRTAE